MHTGYHALIGAASRIPINTPKPIISFSPVVLQAVNRPVPLELRVTVPSSGSSLPMILFSHGQGRSNYLSSLEGYAPLCEFWAAHGFAVFQPTHISSAFIGMKAPQGQEMWIQQRAEDMVLILDQLGAVESAVPGLTGRLDRAKVAVVGHSAGALTAAMLLGARNTDPRDGTVWHKPEPRIKTGIYLAGLGHSKDMHEKGQAMLPNYGFDFGTMQTPSLVVYGDEDVSPWFTETKGPEWHKDAYDLAPGSKDLLVLKGANHILGGISGWDAKETVDESPERLAVVQRMTWAYLRSQLYKEDEAWKEACQAFEGLGDQGSVERK